MKRAKRQILTNLMGKRQSEQLRHIANATRRERDLCLHGDDERRYETQAEAESDQSPSVVCEICGKKKLQIHYLNEAPAKNKSDRITVRTRTSQKDSQILESEEK